MARLAGPFFEHCARGSSQAIRVQAIDALNYIPPQAIAYWNQRSRTLLAEVALKVADDAKYPEVAEDLILGGQLVEQAEKVLDWKESRSALLRAHISEVDERLGRSTAGTMARRGLDPLYAYVAAAPLQSDTALVQRLYVRGSRNEELLPVTKSWTVLFHAWMREILSDLRPEKNSPANWSPVSLTSAAARLGSWEQFWVVNSEVDEEEKISAALDELVLPTEGSELVAGGDWRKFLEAISGRQVSVEIVHYHGAKVWTLPLDQDPMAIARKVVRSSSIATIESRLVPQANKLEVVYELVRILHRGDEVTPKSLQMDKRQVGYYFLAAAALGLVDDERSLLPAARQFVRLDEENQNALIAVLFETSVVGQAWITWSDTRDLTGLSPDSAEAFLLECSRGLNPATIQRRKSTLQSWLRQLLPYHYTKLRRPNVDLDS